MPQRGLANRQSYLLHENEEGACPNRGAMKLSRGQKIVGREDEEKNVGKPRVDEVLAVAERDGKTGDGGNHQRGGGDVDDSLVCGGIKAGAKRKEKQGAKNHHVRQRNDVEGLSITSDRPGASHQ